MCRYRTVACPEALKKKLSCVEHYHAKFCGSLGLEASLAYVPSYIQGQMVYVKKWVKLENATLFRLSNKLFQIVFDDGTEILFDIERKQIIYTGFTREKSVYSLAGVLQSGNADLITRFKFAKEILSQVASFTPKSHKRTLAQIIE